MDTDNIDDSKLKALKTDGGFNVPTGYFEQLRTRTFEATMNASKNTHEFNIPPSYFEKSKSQILSKTIHSKPALKVWYQKPLLKYAAAALFIGTSLFAWYINTPLHSVEPTAISNEEIVNYLEQTDIREMPLTEVYVASMEIPALTTEEILTQTEDYTLTEEL
jgi:hypothetical protein